VRKITLQLESLAVDSFETTAVELAIGTVVAQQGTRFCSLTCADSCFHTACTCPGVNTCLLSCGGSCVQSCNGTCVGYSCEAATCVGTCATCGANTCEPTCGC
jgi:hypothetical protein